MRLGLVLFAATALASCSGSDSSDPPAETSTARELIDAVPLLGVLIADCTDSGTAGVSETQDEVPESPVPLIELPPADSLFGRDIEEFLILLELHGGELPILGGLTSSIEDPALLVPVPLDEVLSILPTSGIPSDTPVLGSTTFGCGEELTTVPFGLVPVFGEVQSS